MQPIPTGPKKRPRRSAQQWRAVVERFEQSPLSEQDFCREEDLAVATFARWRRRFLCEGQQPGFMELQPPSPVPAPPGQEDWTLEVDLPGGGSLRIRCAR